MKIALVRKRFSVSGAGGGAERYGAMVAAELLKRGHRVTVFSEDFQGEAPHHMRWVRVPKFGVLSFCPAMRFHKAFQDTINPSEFDLVYSLCRTYPCDVVRATEQLHLVWLPLRYSPLARLLPRHRGLLKLERKTYSPENARWVVTNSNLIKRQIVQLYHFPSDRIRMIRNGVDAHAFLPPTGLERAAFRERLKLEPSQFAMLFVAENFRVKGLDYALEAFAKMEPDLRKRAVLLVAGGDGPNRYLRQAKRLGLDGQVHFLGRRKAMRELYAASDILLYPSLYETFSNVCLEAAACGLPSISTTMAGASELFEDGVNGFVVKTASEVGAITAALNKVASFTHKECAEMALAATSVAQGLTWERHVDELMELLEAAAAERKGAAL
jgi:UDP-glucose:(heptosyl)LPS alpha-1,3-glucosyltransferase